ncbi:MAG: alpha amylase C-terminal domain-containing protein [Candidatus Eremiobacteraeota bacterium]|nr:alpha amylase C-terminal domain-containing protein [Candidatus Eremiobacteraeota bacterium]
MKIHGNDPSITPRYDAGSLTGPAVPCEEDAAQAEAPRDEIKLEGKRSLDPGNVPQALRAQAKGTTAAAGGGSSSQLESAEGSYWVEDPLKDVAENLPRLYRVPSTQFTGDLARVNDALAQEIVDAIMANSRKWPTTTFVYDAREGPQTKNIKLVGSFNPATGQYDPQWNQGKGVAMYDDGTHGDARAGDGLYTAQVQLDPSQPREIQWGAKGDVFSRDGKLVSADRWLVMTEEPPRFSLQDKETTQTYAPLSNHLMGVHKTGDDGVTFRTWSPEVGKGDLNDYKLHVEIYNDATGHMERSAPMVKDEATGNWSLELPTGWDELEGKSYQYAVRNDKGEPLLSGKEKKAPVIYSDPYSRYLQGQQRGLERIFVDPIHGVETGWYNDSGSGGPNYTINPLWGRFTVNGHGDADKVVLVLKDEQGRQLSKQELLERIGSPDLVPYDKATPQQKRNADILKSWQLDLSGKVTAYRWTDGAKDDGTVEMKKAGDGKGSAWVATINNFPKLEGLQYEFQVYKDGKLVGDRNTDGVLQDGERRMTPFNDPVGNVISARPGAERRSVIRESSFQFRNDGVPRKETDYRKFVIYEAHVGSFMSAKDNANPCNFQDLINNLDYIEKTGSNTIELMPFAEFGGRRDWGYTPDYYFAGAESYGFELPRDKAVELGVLRKDQDRDKESVWVSGTDAIKVFVDEAHRRGLNVFSDVVYNHASGKADADNPLWQIDGDKQSFFKWWGQAESNTPWGAKPNYSSQAVKDFFANNAAQQVSEFHLDGIRFDFTQVLHDTGNTAEKREGMNTLRQINRSIRFISPDAYTYTTAEDFTHNWLVAADLDKSEWQGQGDWAMEKKGMGFSSVWNSSFHHDLLGAIENTKPEKNMDTLMGSVLGHYGVTGWDKGVVFSHNHDEVGNSGSWLVRVAAHSRDDAKVMEPYPRAVARSAAAITLTAAGVPMVFQGEEFVANNDFKHGVTSTWGADYRWLDFDITPDRLDNFKRIAALPAAEKKKEKAQLSPEDRGHFEQYDTMTPQQRSDAEGLSNKAGHYTCYKDLISLRGSSPAFTADSEIKRVYTHNLDRVMAYERKGGNDDYIVVTNFAATDRQGYKIDLPPGNWKEVFNTNARAYGGSGLGNGGAVYDAAKGMTLPQGSTVVFKKV